MRTGEVSSWLVLVHHAAWAHHSQVWVHLLNVLPLKTHNIASVILLPRAGKTGFKERGYVVRNNSARGSTFKHLEDFLVGLRS